MRAGWGCGRTRQCRGRGFLGAVFDQLTILAPGLIGGSVAQAARRRDLAKRIVLWSRRPESRVKLRGESWCDGVCETPVEAVRGAGLVVIAAPVDRIASLAQATVAGLSPGAIVTDVGSVKGEIVRLCETAMPAGVHFVGSHPMAGSEKTGWEHASGDLFERRVCFVTPRTGADAGAVERLVRFWHDLGSEVVTLSPDAHDEVVAQISHLPQVIATTLCDHLARRDSAWRNYAGGGLRDTTRIAGSDPAMWMDILQHNREEILRALRAYQDELHAFQTALANGDWPEVRTRFERGRDYRNGFRP